MVHFGLIFGRIQVTAYTGGIFSLSVFFIPDTLAKDVAYRAEDLAIKRSFCRIKQAIWRVFRARRIKILSRPLTYALSRSKKFPLAASTSSALAIMANYNSWEAPPRRIIETDSNERP